LTREDLQSQLDTQTNVVYKTEIFDTFETQKNKQTVLYRFFISTCIIVFLLNYLLANPSCCKFSTWYDSYKQM